MHTPVNSLLLANLNGDHKGFDSPVTEDAEDGEEPTDIKTQTSKGKQLSNLRLSRSQSEEPVVPSPITTTKLAEATADLTTNGNIESSEVQEEPVSEPQVKEAEAEEASTEQ